MQYQTRLHTIWSINDSAITHLTGSWLVASYMMSDAKLLIRACVKTGNSILRSERDGIRWRTGGEVKGKLANGVGSQCSHTTSERSVSSITKADAHTSAASSRLNWLPRRFKWTRPFRRKKKSGFCACAIRFRRSSTTRFKIQVSKECQQTNINAAVTETLIRSSTGGRDSAIGIVTMLCAGGSGVHIPAEVRDFLPLL